MDVLPHRIPVTLMGPLAVRLRWRECRAHRNPKQAHMSRRSRQGDRSLECWLVGWLLLLNEGD